MNKPKIRKPIKLKITSPVEEKEQEAFIEAMRLLYPDIKFRIGMEGVKLAKATKFKMKKQGMVRGWFDIYIPMPKGKYHSLSIELKRQDGKLLKQDRSPIDERTMKQMEIWRYLNDLNHCAVFAFGAKQALQFVELYLKGLPVPITNGLFSEMVEASNS